MLADSVAGRYFRFVFKKNKKSPAVTQNMTAWQINVVQLLPFYLFYNVARADLGVSFCVDIDLV